MNLVKKDKRLTNFKGAKWVNVLLRHLWPNDEVVKGVESKDEVEVSRKGSNISTFHQPSLVLISGPPIDCGNNDRTDGG
jgi:hypothetical protein